MTKQKFAAKAKAEAIASVANELSKLKSMSTFRVLEERLCTWWDMFANNQSYGEYGLDDEEFAMLCRVFRRMSFDMTSIREVAILVWNQWIAERVAAGESAYHPLSINKMS